MTDDGLLWEDNPDFNRVQSVKFPEGNNKIGDVTIDTFTEAGKKKYDTGTSIKDMVEGTDFNRIIQTYESIPHPEMNGSSYNNRVYNKVKSGTKIAVLSLIVLLSPQMEKVKYNAEKYLSCREYKVERSDRGEYLVGIDCRLKSDVVRQMQKVGYKTL